MLPVTTGMTAATCMAVPLVTPSVVTMAVSGPALVGFVVNVTVSEVAVAAVTVPAAPSLKATVFTPEGSKPKPLIGHRICIGGQIAAGGSDERRDRGNLNCRAAAHAVGRDHGGQIARSGLGGEPR